MTPFTSPGIPDAVLPEPDPPPAGMLARSSVLSTHLRDAAGQLAGRVEGEPFAALDPEDRLELRALSLMLAEWADWAETLEGEHRRAGVVPARRPGRRLAGRLLRRLAGWRP